MLQLIEFHLALILAICLPFSCKEKERSSSEKENPHKPNIILLMTDNQGWGNAGYNSNSTIITPNLDNMANEGIRLNWFYAAAPVCSPAPGSCITGRHPYRYGIYFANVGFLKEQEITLVEELKEKGYTTGHFGKCHLGAISDSIPVGRRGGKGTKVLSTPWDKGFDVCFSTEQAVTTWNPMENQKIKNPTRFWTGSEEYETENLQGDDSRIIMDRAIAFIKKAMNSNKPSFTVIWFHSPHSPVVAGPEYLKMYKEYDENKQHYYGSITAMDEQIARLHNELKKLGVDKNTLITFCSDNGPAGEGGGIRQHKGKRQQGTTGGFRGRKGSLYEGGVRVSAFVVWPGHLDPNNRISYPSVTSDYLITILDILGKNVPDKRPYDGIDLMEA